MRNAAPVTLFLVGLAAAAGAQTPAGPELVVNTYTTAAQTVPAVAMDPGGGFVVVWDSDTQDGSNFGIFGQRFDVGGAPIGVEFRVNSSTLNTQTAAEVAIDARGDFVVSWTEFFLGPDVAVRRFDRSGAPLGADFKVNTYTTGLQNAPAVAIDAAGNFVVVWQSAGQDGDGYGVFGRRFRAGGTSLGTEFQVNSYTPGNQRRPDVAFTADGGFVVVFDGPDNFAQGVHARRFDASGAPIGVETSVATALASQAEAVVVPRPYGGFVVAWTSYGQDGSHNGVFARILHGDGSPHTGELAVNSYTPNGQQSASIATDANGTFVVAWDSFGQDGSDGGVFGQRFDATGARIGGEFAMNTFTTGFQAAPSVAADSAGNFGVTWVSAAQDGSVSGVVARRFQGLAPTALAADVLGNSVLEPSETARIVPTWRNTTVAAQNFVAQLGNFFGPPAVYTILDPLATYGTAAAGATRSCSDANDCYEVSIVGARPGTHWDAWAVETLIGPPAALGIAKRWTLHVGDSFSDVPRTNPFYRFVETLLHHGVTGGCTATGYCPSSPTSREQMAVFVLLAREGWSYWPPDCTSPVFGDVPSTSPYCRWIEELVRRGVVTGCTATNYCPTLPVSREQMAVFVLRTFDSAIAPPACTPPNLYADVPETSPFCRWIEELTVRGVVSGCGGGNYCPLTSVTREQMGVFLGVTFGLTLYGP